MRRKLRSLPLVACMAACAAGPAGGERTVYDGKPRGNVLLEERGWREYGELVGNREEGPWLLYRLESGRLTVGKVMYFRGGEQVGLQLDCQDPTWFVGAVDGDGPPGFTLLQDPAGGVRFVSFRDRADSGWHANFERGRIVFDVGNRGTGERGLDPAATTLTELVQRAPAQK